MTSEPKDGTVKTNPDPTDAVKEALELAIKNLSHEVDLRFGALDRATLVFAQSLENKLSVIGEKIVSTKELVASQASGNKELVTQQATSNKELVNQARELTALALTAALQTQEKSAAETRTFIQESIRQLKSGVDESSKTTKETIEVLRELVTRLGSRIDLAQGGFVNTNDSRREIREDNRTVTDNRGLVVAIVAAVISAAALLFLASGIHR